MSLQDLTILPVKDEPYIQRGGKELSEMLPKPPALLLCISPVKTGKSTILSNLLLRDSMFNGYFTGGIHFISPTINLDKTSRFIRDHPDIQTHDEYSDDLINAITDFQLERDDDLPVAVILDDILGLIDHRSTATKLASRFRHYNIDLLAFSVQKYKGAIPPTIRMNATDVIIGSPFPNQSELEMLSNDFGDLYGGKDAFLELYKKACPKRHDFLYLKLGENPAEAYAGFGEKLFPIGESKDNDEKNISDDTNADEEQGGEEKIPEKLVSEKPKKVKRKKRRQRKMP